MVRGKSRPATLELEVETECDDAETDAKLEGGTELRVDMVGEHLAALSEVCQSLCGREFPHELGMAVLIEHGGMRAPSAVAFLGEHRMWIWIRIYESALAELNQEVSAASVSRMLGSGARCVCGAENLPVAVGRYCAAMSYYGRGTMTKTLACHWPRRMSNVGSRWVTEGPLKVEDPTRKRWTDACAMADLWMGVWFNTSDTMTLMSSSKRILYDMNRQIRFRQGLSEREFLAYANRGEIREAIANANGTEQVRIDGDDYTSRAEWVRVFYNSLRPRPLMAWPHADP
jgi:hypothetical protein